MDIALTFFRTFEAEGELISTRKDIVRKYMRGRFAIDAFSTAPISYVAFAAGSTNPAYRVNRMLRLGRLADFFLSWEKNSNLKPSVIGIIKIVFVVLYMSHFVGCCFHGLTLLVNSTTFTSTANFHQRSFWSRYFRSFYWALISLTGYNASTPVHWAEVAMGVAVTIISIALFGTIIGIFGNLLTNLDSSKLYFRQKMDGINDYMRYKKIPPELQEEVRNYFMYLWKSGKGLDKNKVLDDLPPYLKNKMSTFLNSELIKKVPLFASSKDDTEFITEVVKCLRSRICLPNSFVVRKGEIGTEMYFVSRGELNVINDQHLVVATLKDGMFFGEIAIMYDTKRTASIVARTYCDMFVLTKDDFKKVLRKFPASSREVQEIAKTRYNQTSTMEASKSQREMQEEEEDRDELEAHLPAPRRPSPDSDGESEEMASVAPEAS
uniref:Cyclic nucleotide-binding domain-containing protein n=1 Tax=Neobodo designis TaxID=312471 RepID=A0A7S1KYQ1_NEODS|mmetsp:Transcript_11486/g.35690  ORF Transcript_11486/g.35690 Transcript_11486/m.35690 type:complete len:436 (+) Transcript_11486:1-1308(+)